MTAFKMLSTVSNGFKEEHRPDKKDEQLAAHIVNVQGEDTVTTTDFGLASQDVPRR